MTILNNVDAGVLERVIKETEKLAYERCPAVLALIEKVRLNIALEVR